MPKITNKAEWAAVGLALIIAVASATTVIGAFASRLSVVEFQAKATSEDVKENATALERTVKILSKLEERTKNL